MPERLYRLDRCVAHKACPARERYYLARTQREWVGLKKVKVGPHDGLSDIANINDMNPAARVYEIRQRHVELFGAFAEAAHRLYIIPGCVKHLDHVAVLAKPIPAEAVSERMLRVDYISGSSPVSKNDRELESDAITTRVEPTQRKRPGAVLANRPVNRHRPIEARVGRAAARDEP